MWPNELPVAGTPARCVSVDRAYGRLEGVEDIPTTLLQNAPLDFAEMLVNWMGPFHEGNEQLQRDEAMRSCGIAGQTIMLAAKSMGFDSCPMIGFDPIQVAELINLPKDHVIGFMIAVGKERNLLGRNQGSSPWTR